jgi:hypothetical protein
MKHTSVLVSSRWFTYFSPGSLEGPRLPLSLEDGGYTEAVKSSLFF